MTEAKFAHSAAVIEAGSERQLDFEFAAIAIGDIGQRLAAQALGSELELDGFFAPVSRRSQRLRIHITDYSEISGA